MTHGDKDKAKKPASKASGKSSKAVETGQSAKAGPQTGAKGSEKAAAGGQKAGAPAKAPAKADNGKGAKGSEAGAPAKASPVKAESKAGARPTPAAGKGRPVVVDSGTPGFNNPRVADAFKRAIKKYPNAFRRLTD